MRYSIHYLLTIFLSFQVFNAGAQPHWARVDNLSFAGSDGKHLQASIVTIQETATNIRLVSVPFEVRRYRGPTEASLTTFAEFLAEIHPTYKSMEWIVVNGGFSSYRLDVPLGLLIVDGKVYSRLSNERVKSGFGSTSPDSVQLRWSGVLCQSKDNKNNKTWDIIYAAQYKPELCVQALQAGPFLVEPGGKVGITPEEQRRGAPSARTAICITKDRRIRFITVLEDTYLFPLARWLSKAESEGGLGCEVALNLSGDTSSGIAVRTRRDKSVNLIGEGSFPLPSALIIEGK